MTSKSFPNARGWIAAVTTVIVTAVLVGRNPFVFIEPKLWNEDLWVFLFEQREVGARALLVPYAGYFLFYQRLWAAMAAAFPLEYTPWIYSIGSLVAWWWVSVILVRSPLFPTPLWGAAAAAFIALMPQNCEVILVLTNSQWVLATGLVVLTATTVRHDLRWHDHLFAIVAGLTGPFVTLLMPLAAWRAWSAHSLKKGVDALAVSLAICGGIQLAAVLFTSQRLQASGSITATTLAHGIAFSTAGMLIPTFSPWFPTLMWPAAAVIGIATIGSLVKVVPEYLPRRLIMTAAGIFLVAGIAAFTGRNPPSVQQAGGRYIFIPSALFCVTLLLTWSHSRRKTVWRAIPIAVTCAVLVCTERDLLAQPYPIENNNWWDHCRRLRAGLPTRVRAAPLPNIVVELTP
jgi:hypothetical protein